LVVTTSSIKGFETIRWEDQQKIKEKLGLATSSASSTASANKENEHKEVEIEHFSIEYSKSNRSKCKKCEKRIEKDVVRIMVKHSKSDGYYHLDCFSESKEELGFNFDPEK
jgi:hypothetical protein